MFPLANRVEECEHHNTIGEREDVQGSMMTLLPGMRMPATSASSTMRSAMRS